MSSVQARLLQSDSFRHAAIYAVVFVSSMAVLIAVVYLILDHSFKSNLLREANDDLASIRTAYQTAKPGREEHEASEMIEDRTLAPDADDVFLLERGGVRLAGNLPPMPHRLGTFDIRYPRWFKGRSADDGHTIIGEGVRLSKTDYAFVGRDLYSANETERGVLFAFGLVLVASLMLASVSGLILSRSFLRRVDAITDTCRGIIAGRLGDRIHLVGRNNEVKRLSAVINTMLDRIQSLMESLRQVSNDIAHDLRTPLTHLRYRLERARAEATDKDDYATAVDAAISDCDHLLSIFTALLRIAQIEAGARRAEFRDVNLTALVERARDLYRPVMDDTNHRFQVVTGQHLRVRGDSELLMQMLSNLLDNAISHTPAGTCVTLSAGTEGGRATITVADNGPGISEEDYAHVFRRFFRREQSRTTPGSGLGLSLVAAIADLHGASIHLGDCGPGLRVAVAFASPDGEKMGSGVGRSNSRSM